MTYAKIALACACLPVAVASSAVQAASLSILQGEVLLGRGQGFQAVKQSTDLLIGDTLLAKPNAVARVSYGDGCTVPLSTGDVFRIGDLSPCKPHSAGAGAMGATTDGWDPQPSADEQKPNYLPYVLGAAAIGGIAAGVALGVGGSDGGSGGGGSGGGGGPNDGGGGPNSP